jgi:hypothetical protein
MSQLKTTLCTLPNELILRIFGTLRINDIRQIALVCKRFSQLVQEESLWKILLVHRYGPSKLPPSNPGVSYRAVYQELSKLSVCIADSFSVMHNHAPYWTTVATEDSQIARIYPKVMKLNFVCWIDLSGIISAVAAGTYHVIWTLECIGYVHNMESVEYSAEECQPNGHRTSACITNEYYNDMSGKGPFKYQLPEPLIVEPQGDYVDVHLKVERYDSYWKTGVLFYGVQLVPV